MLSFFSPRVRLLTAVLSFTLLAIAPIFALADSELPSIPAKTTKAKHRATSTASRKKSAPTKSAKSSVYAAKTAAPSLKPQTALEESSTPSNEQIDLTPISPPNPPPKRSPWPPKRFAGKIPIVAQIDLQTETLSPTEIAFLSQTVWNEVQRTQRTYLRTREWTRRVLADQGISITDPYAVPPSRQQMAKALQTDFLILGNANAVGKNLCHGNHALQRRRQHHHPQRGRSIQRRRPPASSAKFPEWSSPSSPSCPCTFKPSPPPA